MSVDINGTTIITFQGDTCSVTFTDLEEGHLIGFEVRDIETNKPIFSELRNTVDSEGEITFTLTPEMTNQFVVNPQNGYNCYLYGLKDINEDTGEENTILLGEDPKPSDRYFIKVYLKKVEGLIENA